MPSTQQKLALAGILLAAAVSCAAIMTPPRGLKFKMSLARVIDVQDTNAQSGLDFRFPIDDTNDDSIVVIRFQNRGSRTLLLGRETIQCKVGGRWLAPTEPSWLNSQ